MRPVHGGITPDIKALMGLIHSKTASQNLPDHFLSRGNLSRIFNSLFLIIFFIKTNIKHACKFVIFLPSLEVSIVIGYNASCLNNGRE